MRDSLDSKEFMDEVKYHSRQKHAFLKAYLDIWSEQVGKKGKTIPTLDIYDMFASYGRCKCSEADEVWDGSALLAARCLCEYSKGIRLWLNSFNENPDDMAKQHAGLNRWLGTLEIPSRVKINLDGKPIEDAINDALKKVNPRYPSLWILDPWSPSQLPWEVVEKVARTEGVFYTKKGKVTRRPELFINLMTSVLQRVSGMTDGQEKALDIALGMPTEEWRSRLDEMREDGLDTREAIVEIYGSKLADIYGKRPIALTVPGTEGNLVYTIFLVTEHEAGYYVMLKHRLQKYFEWHQHEWAKKAKHLKHTRKGIRRAEKAGLKTSLDEYFR